MRDYVHYRQAKDHNEQMPTDLPCWYRFTSRQERVIKLLAREMKLLEMSRSNVLTFSTAVAEIGLASRLFNHDIATDYVSKRSLPEMISLRYEKLGIPGQFTDVFHVLPRSQHDALHSAHSP